MSILHAFIRNVKLTGRISVLGELLEYHYTLTLCRITGNTVLKMKVHTSTWTILVCMCIRRFVMQHCVTWLFQIKQFLALMYCYLKHF